jgi:hypothetical protein
VEGNPGFRRRVSTNINYEEGSEESEIKLSNSSATLGELR